MNANRKAFLDMIAVSEGTKGIGDDGYNVLVGSTKNHPLLFHDYDDHPRQLIYIPNLGISSSAAGRYQIIRRMFDAYKKLLGLPDFSPASQDAIALQMIRERGALRDIDEGRLNAAIVRCRRIWASFPNAGYGQHEHTIKTLRAAYVEAGGNLGAEEKRA